MPVSGRIPNKFIYNFPVLETEKGSPMPRNETVLPQVRKEQIAKAFKTWYDALPERGGARYRAMLSIGGSLTLQNVFRSGERTPTPSMLAKLYELTGDKVYLCTREEKERIRRMNPRVLPLPSVEQWPDSDAIATPVERSVRPNNVDAIAMDIRVLSEKIRRLGELEPTDPKRLQARKALSGPAMALFRATMTLKLEVPKDFEDLLRQIDLATTVLK